MSKKIQWNFKEVPEDIFKLVLTLQTELKLAKKKNTSRESVCYMLIRRGAKTLSKEQTEAPIGKHP